MAITLVETPGAANANSFISVADADDYLEARLNASAWNDDATAEEKKAALVEATRDVDAAPWKEGDRVTASQALSWPRENAWDPDRPADDADYYGTTVVPARVQYATAELALAYLKAGATDLAARAADAEKIRTRTDVLETEYVPARQRLEGLARFPRVLQHLGPLLAVDWQRANRLRVVRG